MNLRPVAILLGLTLIVAVPRHAYAYLANTDPVTVTFQNVGIGNYGPIPNGYGGLNWSSDNPPFGYYVANGDVYSGYDYGQVDGPFVASATLNPGFSITGPGGGIYTAPPNDAIFSIPGGNTFTLYGMYMTSPQSLSGGENVTLTGRDGSTLLDSVNLTVGPSPTLYAFNWAYITSVTLSTQSPMGADIDVGEIQYGDVAPTPLPAVLPAFSVAIAGLAVFGLRQTRRAGKAFVRP